jgi:hypothetical protein
VADSGAALRRDDVSVELLRARTQRGRTSMFVFTMRQATDAIG